MKMVAASFQLFTVAPLQSWSSSLPAAATTTTVGGQLSSGQVIGPNYRKVFNGTGFPFCKQLACGILSGARIPSTLHLQFSPFPWIHIGIREYWMLCRGSIFSYTQKRRLKSPTARPSNRFTKLRCGLSLRAFNERATRKCPQGENALFLEKMANSLYSSKVFHSSPGS